MKANTANRLTIKLIPVLAALASFYLGHAHAVAQSVAANSADLAVCDEANLEAQSLPIIDAADLVAEQLRNTIDSTAEPVLRTKLRQAYLRYLGCLKPEGNTPVPQDHPSAAFTP